MTNSQPDREGFLNNVREELRHWPYTLHQIDDTLDSSLIEGRGKQILFQALNAGMLTAFVGSGVSAAYGRLGWNEWKTEQLKIVGDVADLFEKVAAASLERMEMHRVAIEGITEADSNPGKKKKDEKQELPLVYSWLGYRMQSIRRAAWEVKNLRNTFNAAQSGKGSFPGGEDLPILFEIAKKLHEHLQRHRELFLPVDPETELSDFDRFFGTRCTQASGVPEQVLDRAMAILSKNGGSGTQNDYIPHIKAYRKKYLDPQASLDFHEIAKRLLVDEVAHVEKLFEAAFQEGTEFGRSFDDNQKEKLKALIERPIQTPDGNLRRNPDGIRDLPGRYAVMSVFRLKQMALFAKYCAVHAPRNTKGMVNKLADEIEKLAGLGAPLDAGRVFLTPTSRFLLPMLCQLVDDPIAFWSDYKNSDDNDDITVRVSDFESRRSIVEPLLDPLNKTIGSLKINRYLTTNYDFEIERQFQDRGYRQFDDHATSPAVQKENYTPGERTFRVDGLGGVLSDMTFSEQTSTDLLCFSAGAGPAEASVFHLHGRATVDDKIVATERDYMDQYMRNSPNREVVDESILMAFAATPILFLGLGMEESDVLRPLRQFISDNDRSIGYQSIVLLPATSSFESRAKTSAGLYMRYGAHTIFYGGGEVKVKAKPKSYHQPLDWLNRVGNLIGVLGESVKLRQEKFDEIKKTKHNVRLEDLNADLAKPIVTLEKLSEEVGELGEDLVVPGKGKKDSSALAVLLGMSNYAFNRHLKSSGILPEKYVLKTCSFTTRRHGSGEMLNANRQVQHDGKPYTGFYTALLSELMHIALRDMSGLTVAEARRTLTALKTGLDGIKSGMYTATFSASLDGIEKEWRNWWVDWQHSPPKREASFERIQLTAKKKHNGPGGDVKPSDTHRHEVILPQRFIRHRVVNVITDVVHCQLTTAPAVQVKPGDSEVFADRHKTNVRVFDSFIAEVAENAQETRRAKGRLLQTVAAERGRGKGVMFSVFSTRLGVTSYLRAAHPNTGIGDGPMAVPFFFSSFFLNLSFAPEVGSVFDMMRATMIDQVAALQAASCGTVFPATVSAVDRKKALESFLKSGEMPKGFQNSLADLQSKAEEAARTLASKYEKGRRTESLFLLLGEFEAAAKQFATRNCFGLKLRPRILICINAVDVLYDSEKRPKNMEIADVLAFLTSDEASTLPLDLIVMGDLGRMGVRGDGKPLRVTAARNTMSEDRRRNIALQASRMGVDVRTSLAGIAPEKCNFVHFAKFVEPKQFLVDNFLPLAVALLVARRKADGKKIPAELDQIGAKLFESRQRDRDEKWGAPSFPDANEILLDSRETMNGGIAKALIGSKFEIDNNTNWNCSQTRPDLNEVRSKIQGDYDGLGQSSQSASEDWRDAFRVFGGNRFSLTILLAAAEHLVFTRASLSDGGARADDMLRNIVARIRNVSVSRRESEVLKAVMGIYQDSHRIGDPDHDHTLHTHLLRNIAVLGCPVSPNILVRLPDIRDYFNSVQMQGALRRRRVVARALSVLCARGLVFRISPHPKLLRLEETLDELGQNTLEEPDFLKTLQESEENRPLKDAYLSFRRCPAKNEYRYALHRQVQSYCFQRLGHMTAPPVTANNFAPTLYASMPSRVVRLSNEGYLFLRRLLLGLSQYPDIRHEDSARDIPIFNDDDPITRVQALRCAMSLARTSFSIAAVSRFSEDTDGLNLVRKRGYFETYRVRLRWLLRKAWEVHEPRQEKDPKGYRVNALYHDEIVWLYNEVAVTCLVQGALVEAVGHARQAMDLNRQVEGSVPGGRMHNAIALNLAIIQFERGRLASAARRFREISLSEAEHKPRVYWLAVGYGALVDQLMGRTDEAKQGLNEALNGLKNGEEDRALSLMTHHLARLLASEKPDQAGVLLNRARDYAESGGHEDIRHRVMISEVWVSQSYKPDPWKRVQADSVKLREIEHYARMMGMHALLVDCLHAQGRMLLESGDHSSSGRLMTRAMAIARRHEMNLRLNTIMTSYAKVLLARRRISSAKRLLNSALAIAKGSGYSIEVVRIHQALELAEEKSIEEA